MNRCKFVTGYSGGTEFEVDKEMFHGVVEAKRQIALLFKFEDSYKLLSDSVYEFELHLLDLGLRYQLGRANTEGYERFFDEARQTINLKLISLLTSGRIFIEQATSLFNKMGRTEDAKSVFSNEFDKNFQYRLGEALRNHSLHHSLPLSRNVFSRKKLYEDGRFAEDSRTRDRFSINPQISVEDFLSAGKMRSKTKAEVEALSVKYLDLKYVIRGYVSGLARCHARLRGETAAAIEESINSIEGLVAHCVLDNKKEAYFYIGSCGSKEREVSTIEICPKKLRRIKDVRSESDAISRLPLSFLSSEVTKRKDSYPPSDSELWISE